MDSTHTATKSFLFEKTPDCFIVPQFSLSVTCFIHVQEESCLSFADVFSISPAATLFPFAYFSTLPKAVPHRPSWHIFPTFYPLHLAKVVSLLDILFLNACTFFIKNFLFGSVLILLKHGNPMQKYPFGLYMG